MAGTAGKRALRELDAQVPRISPQNSLSIVSYYRNASAVHAQAMQYVAERDDVRAYVYLKKFVSFYLHTIAAHNAYNQAQYRKEKLANRRLCNEALGKLEALAVRIRDHYDALEAETIASLADSEQAGHAGASGADTAPDTAPDEPQTQAGPLAAATPPLSRPGSSWDNLKLPTPAARPTKPTPAPASSQQYPGLPKTQRREAEVAGHPVAPAETKQPSYKLQGVLGCRAVHCPESAMAQFLKVAAPNTRRDTETCGILCGVLKRNELFVTQIVLPKQTGTSNKVATHAEEELFEYQLKHDLLTLGWIHTHPSQECFLSSIDLHTSFGYQIMMPEALAIVLAPSKVPSWGAFSLTAKGMGILSQCGQRGFHRHFENEGLYGIAQHAKFTKAGKVKIVDMRK